MALDRKKAEDRSHENILRRACLDDVLELNCETLVSRIDRYADVMGTLEAYRFLSPGGSEEYLTYAGLQQRAHRLAKHAQSFGLKPGTRVALIIEPSLEFVVAFFACMVAGLVAVPLPRPRSDAARERINAVLADANCEATMTTQTTVQALGENIAGPLIFTGADQEGEDQTSPIDPSNPIALLQYTSGSTGTPKATMISHANLAAARSAINAAAQLGPDDIILSWLPMEHDMGLIGGMLQPFWMCARCLLMAPEHFLARPLRWMQAISHHRASVTVAPDFAYAQCARLVSPAAAARLDLSCVAVAFSGAEPLRSETIEGFCGAFEPCGFRRTAFLPCYGLAEATLLVAGEPRNEPPHIVSMDPRLLTRGQAVPVSEAAGRKLVSSGPPAPPNLVRIVDPDTSAALSAGRIGEIWVAGGAVSSGYYGNPDATSATFNGKIEGESVNFLRTGDLGFLHEGRLFVTGRRDARILRRGQTHHAADLEAVGSGAHDALRAGRLVIVQTGLDDQIVALQEINPSKLDGANAAARSLWGQVARRAGLSIDRVCLLSPGTLLWTTSGKLRRSASLDRLDTEPERLEFDWTPPDSDQAFITLAERLGAGINNVRDVEAALCTWVAAVAGIRVDEVEPDLPWADLSVDSLRAAELIETLETALGHRFEADLLFKFYCPTELARHLATTQS